MFSTDHLHPMLVHFPIALVALGFVAELASLFIKKEVCFYKIGFYLLIVGTLSAVITVLSGLLFTGEMSGIGRRDKRNPRVVCLDNSRITGCNFSFAK